MKVCHQGENGLLIEDIDFEDNSQDSIHYSNGGIYVDWEDGRYWYWPPKKLKEISENA